MRAWLAHNLHSLRAALDGLRNAPLANLFTVLVIGIALSLPTGLYLALSNLQQIAGDIGSQAELSVFLKAGTEDAEGRKLAEALAAREDIQTARFVDRKEGLERLQQAGLGDISAGLPDNPLPHAILLTPREVAPEVLEALAADLGKMDAVDRVSLDAEWVKRLAALMRLGEDLVGMLAVLLGLALAAITGNTIRLQIYARREEIEVARLIGATDRFIRRPFLYYGALQGLAGGLAAWFIVSLAVIALQDSAAQLATSYGSRYFISALSLSDSGLLLSASTLLGFAGAYFAVSQALRQIDTA